MKASIRHMCLGDLPEIVKIEAGIATFPWSADDFIEAKAPGTRGHIFVSTHETRVLGYAVFEVGPGYVEILKLGVAADCRRQGIGSLLLERIRGKMYEGDELVMYIPESNLPAQLFLRKHGLRATIRRGYFAHQRAAEYDGEGMPWHYEDAYRFQLQVNNRLQG